MPVVTGKVKWASVKSPNTKFTPQWCIDVILDVQTAKSMKAEGYNVKKDKDGDLVLKCKRNVKRADGTENAPPRVVDSSKQPFNDLIGNGSVCNIQYTPFPYTYAGRSGIATNLIGVQVMEHVPYLQDEFEVVEKEGEESSIPHNAKDAPYVDGLDDFDDDIPFN